MNLNPFDRTPREVKAARRYIKAYNEVKSLDVLPESMWQQLVALQDMGQTIGLEQAVGLPAVLSVIRFLSHAAGMVPLNVIRGDSAQANATDAWQYRLLRKRPGPPPVSPFNFKADIAANFCGRGNAYVRKYKPSVVSPRLTRDTPRVTELKSLYSPAVTPKRLDSGSIVYTDATERKPVDRGTDEIVQIRSFTVDRDGLKGLSPISAARMFVSAGLKRHQFEERHLTNGISPSLAVGFPRGMDETQGGKWLDFIEHRHKGSSRAGKLLGYPDGATLTPMPISLEDALFADMTRLTLEQACGIYQVPLAILTPQRRPVTDDDFRHFSIYSLGPIVTATAEAFMADDDLFTPYTADDDLTVQPDTDALLRLDPLKKAQVQHQQIQDGTRLVDELRNADGFDDLPPVPEDWTKKPGKVPQITPVGGAPNPEVDTTEQTPGAEPSEGDEEDSNGQN